MVPDSSRFQYVEGIRTWQDNKNLEQEHIDNGNAAYEVLVVETSVNDKTFNTNKSWV